MKTYTGKVRLVGSSWGDAIGRILNVTQDRIDEEGCHYDGCIVCIGDDGAFGRRWAAQPVECVPDEQEAAIAAELECSAANIRANGGQ